MHHALHVAKRVRSETGIADSAVSISYTAVELGRKVFGSLNGTTILLVGAGEMAELAAQHLAGAGAEHILVANRTRTTAEELAAKFNGEVVNFDALPAQLAEADIIICSTGAREYIITPQMARAALETRRNRPAFYIDISVPRNVDPAVGGIIASNIREREHEAERAELIVASEVMQFQQALRAMDIGPTVGAIRQKFQDIAKNEYQRQRNKLGALSAEQEHAVESLLLSVVNKIAHPVINRVRRSHETGVEENLQAWREIFALDEKENGQTPTE